MRKPKTPKSTALSQQIEAAQIAQGEQLVTVLKKTPNTAAWLTLGEQTPVKGNFGRGFLEFSLEKDKEIAASLLQHFTQHPEKGPDVIFIHTPVGELEVSNSAGTADVKLQGYQINTSFTAEIEPERGVWLGKSGIFQKLDEGATAALVNFTERAAASMRGPMIAPINHDTIAKANNSPSARELSRAIVRKDTWLLNKHTGTKYHESKSGVFTYQPPEIAEWFERQSEAALVALDKRFSGIKDDITADVIDILFHHWNTYPSKKRDKASITLAQICEYRDVLPSGDNLKNAWQSMRDIRAIRLRGNGIDAALFEMDAARLPQGNLFDYEAPAEPNAVFFYSPGFFLAEAIEGNPVYLAPYMRKIWQLNPKQHYMAKRILRYIRGEWRMNTEKYLLPKGKPRKRFLSWFEIMDGSGIDVEEWRATKDPSRLITTVETALKTLWDMEFIAECGPEIYEYPSHYENLPRKGKLAAWLALRVHISPAADHQDGLTETNDKRLKRQEAVKVAALKAPKK